MLLFARQGDSNSLWGISQSASSLKATLISGPRLGCFTYGWLTLLEFMVQFMWIVVLSCSARMAFLTPFPMLRISECWLCLCQNAKFEALQHAPSLVTRSLVAWSPAGLLWKTKAPKLLSDWTSASMSEKVNISWGQRSIDAINPV